MANVTGMRLVAHDDGTYDIVAKRAPDMVVVSPVGGPMRQIYKRKYNERHSAVYIPTKEINMYDRIQSYAKQCDKVALFAKAKTDPSVLQQRQGFYGDLTALGDVRNMYTAYNLMKGDFDKLGEKEKAQLGGSFESFLSCVASGTLASANSAEGVKAEPAKSEPAKSEPAKAEPTKEVNKE